MGVGDRRTGARVLQKRHSIANAYFKPTRCLVVDHLEIARGDVHALTPPGLESVAEAYRDV
jgi:hypothetical protein